MALIINVTINKADLNVISPWSCSVLGSYLFRIVEEVSGTAEDNELKAFNILWLLSLPTHFNQWGLNRGKYLLSMYLLLLVFNSHEILKAFQLLTPLVCLKPLIDESSGRKSLKHLLKSPKCCLQIAFIRPTNSPKPEDSSFTIRDNKGKLQIIEAGTSKCLNLFSWTITETIKRLSK